MGNQVILEEEQEEDQENQEEEEDKQLLVVKSQSISYEGENTSVKNSLYYKVKLLKFIILANGTLKNVFRCKEVEEDTYLSNYKAEDAKAPCIYHVIIFRQFSDRYPCCDPLFY